MVTSLLPVGWIYPLPAASRITSGCLTSLCLVVTAKGTSVAGAFSHLERRGSHTYRHAVCAPGVRGGGYRGAPGPNLAHKYKPQEFGDLSLIPTVWRRRSTHLGLQYRSVFTTYVASSCIGAQTPSFLVSGKTD